MEQSVHWILEIMQSAPAFAGSVAASMLEPFLLTGCVMAGALIRNVWLSLLAAGAWALILQKFVILPRVEAMHWAYTADMLWGSLLAAWLTTGIVRLIARSPRR